MTFYHSFWNHFHWRHPTKNFSSDPKRSLKKVSIQVATKDYSKWIYNLLKTELALPIGGTPAVHRGPQSTGTTGNIRDDLKYLFIALLRSHWNGLSYSRAWDAMVLHQLLLYYVTHMTRLCHFSDSVITLPKLWYRWVTIVTRSQV